MVASLLQEYIVRKVAVIENGLYIVDVEKVISLWKYILWMGKLSI